MKQIYGNGFSFNSNALFMIVKCNVQIYQHEISNLILNRAKKFMKQLDRLQMQLADEKTRNRELSTQLTEAADYKVSK